MGPGAGAGGGPPLGGGGGGPTGHDDSLLGPTLDTVATHGLLADLGTLHLDRGYDTQWVRAGCAARGLGDLVIAERKRKNRPKGTKPRRIRVPLGLRWPVERTNSWLSNYGQMRRNTDRCRAHRVAQMALPIA